MPSGDRALDPATEEALRRLRNERAPWWDAYGPVVPPRGEQVWFEVADQPLAIEHGLGEVPEGMVVVVATGPVFAAPGQTWDRTLAWVQSSVANTRARFIFYTCRGEQR